MRGRARRTRTADLERALAVVDEGFAGKQGVEFRTAGRSATFSPRANGAGHYHLHRKR